MYSISAQFGSFLTDTNYTFTLSGLGWFLATPFNQKRQQGRILEAGRE